MSFSVMDNGHGRRVVRTMLPVVDEDGTVLIAAGEEITTTPEGRIVHVADFVAHEGTEKDIVVAISDSRRGGSVVITIDTATWDALLDSNEAAAETLILLKYREGLAR